MMTIDCANYNIRFMMNQNNKLTHIKSQFHRMDEEVMEAIRRQVEYYFTMANLATDALLKKMIDSNHRGWVKIKDLAKFNRLRMLIARAF
jgi:hypothetical protein